MQSRQLHCLDSLQTVDSLDELWRSGTYTTRTFRHLYGDKGDQL